MPIIMNIDPDSRDKVILDLLKKNPDKTDRELTRILIDKHKEFKKIRFDTVRRYVSKTRIDNDIPLPHKEVIEKIKQTPAEERAEIKEKLKSVIKTPKSLIDICNVFQKPPAYIESILDELKAEHYNLLFTDAGIELSKNIKQGGRLSIDLSKFNNKIYKFGITADNHLNSKFERLDILNALYDRFEQEGIKEVYNAGNWIDGEAKFNKYEVFNIGIDPQINYFLKNYPQRKGITTYFIAGDDHEGWYVQNQKIDIGKYAEMRAREMGRDDLIYLGYVEADIEFKSQRGKAIMKVMHPGGGSAYALSYSPQKMIESFQGGEKPHILVLGHYHKADYMYYRDIHCLQAACTQDQTIFMRKKRIQAALGGWIVEMQQSADGAINRFKTDFMNFFDQKYYKKQGYYR
jgi:hypothetical protein